nr:hypothetical protein GCM10025699_36510 [Microbacterium flavescens]
MGGVTIAPVPRVGIIVVAAGSGTRLGAGAPKGFVGIDGHTILRHALERVFDAPSAQVVVVAPPGREGDALSEALEAAGDRRDLVTVVAGGQTRQSSVQAGLSALWADVEIVLVHDAARALTPPEVFERIIEAIDSGRAAAIPVLPVVDTIKRVSGPEVVGGVDRSELSAAQTPRGSAARCSTPCTAMRLRSSPTMRRSWPRRVIPWRPWRGIRSPSRSRRRSISTAPAGWSPRSRSRPFPRASIMMRRFRGWVWAPTSTRSAATARCGSPASNGRGARAFRPLRR